MIFRDKNFFLVLTEAQLTHIIKKKRFNTSRRILKNLVTSHICFSPNKLHLEVGIYR